MSEEVEVYKTKKALALQDELSVSDVLEQIKKIQEIMKKAMKEDEHYGVIPGTNKPTLYKAGAEKLGLVFRFSPEFEVDKIQLDEDGHKEFIVKCTLRHINSQLIMGEGLGSCSTMESKYRYRWDNTNKPVPKEYWQTRDKDLIGGDSFVARKTGENWFIFQKVEHDDPADYYNTVLKMAKKRAHIDAMLTATAASDIFTQDLEDIPIQKEEKIKNSEKKKEDKTKPKNNDIISEAQRKRLFALGKNNAEFHNDDHRNEIIKEIVTNYNYRSSKEIKKSDYDEICRRIENWKEIKKQEELPL